MLYSADPIVSISLSVEFAKFCKWGLVLLLINVGVIFVVPEFLIVALFAVLKMGWFALC